MKTSYMMVLDMDMWLSKESYEILLQLPQEIQQDTRTAIVIPAFFHTGWTIQNGTLEEQVQSVIHRIPFSMDDLIKCVDNGKCSKEKKNLFTHVNNGSFILYVALCANKMDS